MKNVVALTMVFTLGLLQIGVNEASTRLQRKQQQRQQVDDTLQCYICENCPDIIDEQSEMVLCGAMSLPPVVSNGNNGAVPVAAATTAPVNGTTKAPEISEEYDESDYNEDDEDYDERKAVRTLTSTTKPTTASTTRRTMVQTFLENKIPEEEDSYEYESAESVETIKITPETTTTTRTTSTITKTPITTTTTTVAIPAILQTILENEIPEEDFYSYEYESSESEQSIKKETSSTTTTKTTTSSTTTTTIQPIISVNNIPETDFDNYEYEDTDSESLEDYDRHRIGGKARQSSLEPNVCYSIKLRTANNAAITNRGCATLIRGNKSLTCQSLSKGLPILNCLVCDKSGCNSYSNQFVASSSQGLSAGLWIKIFSVAVLLVAILIRP